MEDVAIIFQNISKQYRLGQIGTGTLSHDLNRWFHKIRGMEDPYLKLSETNDRAHKGGTDYVWALRNIDFELKKGEVLGIIGKNGAGKSTLLKILSKVTKPTEGTIKAKGRIASLLEIGTGFHQEMTGRENIYMNGSIMGMTKGEITRKFDEIVDFSGVERYVDTPVKRYSSGMTVRLGFAIAAHLEPEILVVDEVLAVGDAEFQKKAVGKMQEVSNDYGRTVLFVSHNMTSVKGLCKAGIWLKDGLIYKTGNIHDIVNEYLTDGHQTVSGFNLANRTDYKHNGILRIGKVAINSKGSECGLVINTERVILQVQILNAMKLKGNLELAGRITNQRGYYIHYFSSKLKSKIYKVEGEEEFLVQVEFDRLALNQGTYFVGFEIKFQNEIVYYISESIKFDVIDNDFYNSGVVWSAGTVLFEQEWS
ncbi:MAG: lipopolysaccharide transport system ATP-binding [Prolixibacteraceae bacterium]|nr:MAG: lipopolysaccharide transport system ATP-binding [Prolixibacteraceae bacterium]